MEENPSITVEIDFNNEWETKLLTQVAGGTPPDATYTNWVAQANLASKNTFIALDDYVSGAGLSRDEFVISMWDASVYNGKLYALPGGADYISMWWSKDVYEDVGFDPDAPPVSAGELMDHSKEILKFDDAGNIERVGYIPNAGQFIQWAYIFGGDFYDADNQKVTADAPANVEALQWIYDYVQLLDIDKLNAFNARPGVWEPGNPFSTKQAAYVMDGFWFYEALDLYSPDIDYGIAVWPTLTGAEEERSNYLIQGWMYGIPNGAENVDAAWQFMKYAFVDEAALMGYSTLNGPCYKAAFPAFEEGVLNQIGDDNRMAPYFHVFTEIGSAGEKHWPNMPANSFLYDEVVRVYDFVVRGEMTPEEGLAEATANAQAELDRVLSG
jgi:ABC-type glycerol-3-phosphate transport system substrate-binding protein